MLVKKVVSSGGEGKWNDASISPVVRQTCECCIFFLALQVLFPLANQRLTDVHARGFLVQHWGYILTEDDYKAFIT